MEELKNLFELRDTIQEALSSKIFGTDLDFLRMYNETDQKINCVEIEIFNI